MASDMVMESKNTSFKKHQLVNGLFLLIILPSFCFYFGGKYDFMQPELALAILLLLLAVTYGVVRKFYLQPLKKLVKSVNSNGYNGKDEVESLLESYQTMQQSITAATDFIRKVEEGKLDEAEVKMADDGLGTSLLNMKEHLRKISAQEGERIWVSEGLAKFSELLRAHDADLESLGLDVLAFLIKYIKANQGALFIVQDNESEAYMEMVACYAYDKKKYLEKKIYKGEGLAGQAWMEQDTIYLTDIPKNYIEITSGLGNANPSCILIVPLKVNDEIFGIMELASFTRIPQYQVEFIQKLTESLASSVSMLRVNERTRRLLEESQELTEQMRAQEEEMRQNVEELTATQEELQRKEAELDQKLQEALKEIELGQIHQQMNEIRLQIESRIDSSKGDLKFLSNVPPVQGLVRAMAHDGFDKESNSSFADWIERMDTIFRNFLINKELFQSISFTDEKGRVVYALAFKGRELVKNPEGADFQDQEIFINTCDLQKGEVYVGQIKTLADQLMVMEFGIAVYNEQNELKGTLLVNLFAKTIMDGIKAKESEEHAYGLYNREGTCIYGEEWPAGQDGLQKVVMINEKQNLSLTIRHQTLS